MNELINEQRDQIAQLTAERDALAAHVEALTSAYKNLCGAIDDMDNCESGTDEMETAIGAVFSAMRNGYNSVHATPQHHLRQVRADAYQSGFVKGAKVANESPEIYAMGLESVAKQYAASILAGKDGK